MSLLHHSSPLVMASSFKTLTHSFGRNSTPTPPPFFFQLEKGVASIARLKSSRIDSNVVSLFQPIRDQPILRDAIKEPLAFVGGMIAGFLKLDNEEPLKEWIVKTVEASGMLDSDDAGGGTEGSTDGGANSASKLIKIE
ncbi:UPF0426 protein, chloroplastic [Iris pallida]|uniref:UPF0426 protein, chloroplastic n=1 Tax=Iris pallida TaxID=29817 RepID=A0AAX6HG55_IRIPA|nr:UPF0426 protein, chloroplastic [Iris pallida]